jgi:flavin reductase (DIM6/NTAB) family NADH-FMN oxidoreductase RutF
MSLVLMHCKRIFKYNFQYCFIILTTVRKMKLNDTAEGRNLELKGASEEDFREDAPILGRGGR